MGVALDSKGLVASSKLSRLLFITFIAAITWTTAQIACRHARTTGIDAIQGGSMSTQSLPRQAGLEEAEHLADHQTRTQSQAAQDGSAASQRHPMWDDHIIFNGTGWISTCPSDTEEYHNGSSSSSSSSSSSKGWIKRSWLQPVVPTASPSGSSSRHQSSFASGRGLMLPHSAYVQRKIWEHQHPQDCKTAKFLLWRDPLPGKTGQGIGSVLHTQTVALLYAMNTGRVLVTLPGSYLAADPYCGKRATADSCYFEPLTHCKVTQEQAESAMKAKDFSKEEMARFRAGDHEGFPQFVSLEMWIMSGAYPRTAPRPFQALLETTDIPKRNWYYWWRAQGIAYIMRPNERTQQELARRYRAKLRGAPLAPGCVTMYVRHGDKGKEAKLYADAEYEDAVNQLRTLEPGLTRQVFLSTEDPVTVQYFTNVTRGWQTTYVDMPRKPNRKKSNLAYMQEHGFANEMLDGLLNLDLSLQCDGFVSGISSNWARLIDELRSTVRCKAQHLWMDVEYRSTTGFNFRS